MKKLLGFMVVLFLVSATFVSAEGKSGRFTQDKGEGWALDRK